MTSKEAIEIIKSNYPPENYTLLREALDIAIEELRDEFMICPNCGMVKRD